MSAGKFIDHVAATGSVDDAILEKLRRKVAKSKKPVSIEAIVKVLMDQGHLTRFLATKLLTEYSQSLKSEGKTEPSLRAPKTSSQSAPEGDLGFAPDESLDGRTSVGDIKKEAAPTPEEDDIVDLEDASESGSKGQLSPSEQASTAWQGTDRVSTSAAPLADSISPADPLADLPADDPLAGDFGEYQKPAHQSAATPSSGGLQLPEPTRSQWDTKLIIGGSLALGILAIAAFGLFFVLRSGSATEVFEAAEKDYNTGAYQNAIDKYQLFLKKYPKHDNASLAWVRQKMAGLRQNIGRPTEALAYALKELPELKVQPAFGEARGELASLLPSIAESFADKAAKARDTEKKSALIAAAEKSMEELVNQAAYIPSKMHKNPDVASRIKRIKEKIKNVRRNIDRENNLVAAVKKINEFTNKSKTSDAFVARRTLLENYPGLEDDERLVEAVINISKKEAELVSVKQETKKPVTSEVAGSLQNKNLPKRSNVSKDIPGVAGHVCCVLAGGAVYGIDVTTGNSRWRRFVGAETTVHPQPVSSELGADVLLIDSKKHDLMRVKSQTGELVWRLPIGKPFLTPVHYKDLLLINTRDGRLLEVNLKTGANTRIVEFPMELGTAASYGDEQPLLYQAGEHNNLYVVDIETMECKEVLYVGHKKGSMKVPPVYAVGFLMLIENIASDRSILHVIAMNEKGQELKEI
ncbi:MAG: PQQ-binding-like beta-propeller repeat protein, partial [Pirellulaceae bacterium]